MRYAFAAVALWMVAGCASPAAMQEAVNRCATVGISARDVDFATCTEAYRLESQQAGISDAYNNAVDRGPPRRRALH